MGGRRFHKAKDKNVISRSITAQHVHVHISISVCASRLYQCMFIFNMHFINLYHVPFSSSSGIFSDSLVVCCYGFIIHVCVTAHDAYLCALYVLCRAICVAHTGYSQPARPAA